MTSTDALIEALLSEAQDKAKLIIQDAKKTVEIALDEQRQKGIERAKERVLAIDKKAENDSVVIKLRNTASAEREAKWVILEKKHALIEEVINQVKNGLLKWVKTEKYLPILENLIVEGGIIVGGTEMEVVLNERDSALSLDLGKLAEKISKSTGNKTILTKSTNKIDTIGGALIQTIDGKIVMDNTFEGMLKNSESEIKFKIAQILFT